MSMNNSANNSIEIDDIENFIDGLKNSFDKLGEADPIKSQGFQSQLAKAISMLRAKKVAIMEQIPKFEGHFTKDDLKNFLINQLEAAKTILDNDQFPNNKRKFDLVMKIAKLREDINNL